MIPARRQSAPGWLLAELRGATAALAFLTRVPVGRWVRLETHDIARGAAVFPVVGAGIGAATGLIATALAGPLPPPLAVMIAVTAVVIVTGAMHLDALADTADALGARSRQNALAIMRDHAVGAYGAVAIGLALLLTSGGLVALVANGHAVQVAIAAGALSRASPVALAALLPNARGGDGAGGVLARMGPSRAPAAAALAVAIAVGAAGTDGLMLAGLAAAVSALWGSVVRSWLGGVTGDVLGALVETIHITALIAGVALIDSG